MPYRREANMGNTEAAGGIVDGDNQQEDLDTIVARASYEWLGSQGEVSRSPTSVDIRSILGLPFDEFMSLPMVQDLDWSRSDAAPEANQHVPDCPRIRRPRRSSDRL